MNVRRPRRLTAPILVLACLLGPAVTSPVTADYIDAINPDAVPEPRTNIGGSLTDFGWYYTPTQSYMLTGISSYFEPINFGTGSRTITFQIQTDRPASGGTVLAQGGVVGDSNVGGVIGATFNPVALTAGTTYFVDILNINGMGIDEGQWASVNGVHVATAGATTRLSAWYIDDAGDSSFATARVGNAADQSNANGTVSGLEPILYFGGFHPSAVPEPSGLILLATGACGLLAYGRRGRPASHGRAGSM